MSTLTRTTSQTSYEADTYRQTATTVGALYLAGMAIGIGGNVLVLSILSAPGHLTAATTSSLLLAVAAVLWLLTVAGDVAHGILMFPVLKRHHNERLAVGYLGFRILDATFIAIMVLLILIQIPIADQYLQAGAADASYLEALSAVFNDAQLHAYNIAMLTLGVAGLLVCYAFYATKLLPRPLAVWGLIGYAVILGGSVLEILGVNLSSIHAVPGGLWEVFIGFWLIAKGFSSPDSALTPAASAGEPAAETPSHQA